MKNEPSNIGPSERRKRLYGGIFLLLIAILATVGALYFSIRPFWRLVLFLPYTLGILSVLQYQGET